MILLFEFGSPLYLTREVAFLRKRRTYLNSLVMNSIFMKLFLFPLGILLTLISIKYIPIFHQNPSFVYIVLIGSFFQGISPTWYYVGLEKMKKIGLSKIFFRTVGFIFIFVFVRTPEDSWIVLIGYSLTSFLICLYLFIEIFKEIKTIKLPNFNDIQKLFCKSVSSFFITFFPVFYQSLSIILLSLYVGPFQLGIFYGANRIYRAMNSLFSPMGQAFFPRIAYTSSNDLIKAKNLIKSAAALFLFFGTTLFILLLIFSSEIIFILLGEQFLESSKILILFGSVLPLTAISHVFGRQWMMAINQESDFSKVQFLSSSFSFLIFIYIIKDFTVMAIPISLIAYEISSIILMIFFCYYKK